MRKYSIPVLFFFMFCFSSCFVGYIGIQTPMDIRENFACYTGETTNISSLININGYYTVKKSTTMYLYPNIYERIDTFFYINFMFFDDGIYLYNFNVKSIYETWFYKYSQWGCYAISSDTIKTKLVCIYPPSSGPPYASEDWYMVIDRNTIKEIFSKPLHRTTQAEMENYLRTSASTERQPATFVPMDSLPNSDNCWLKKEKWFWSNEKDWEEYMDSLKQDKKKKNE